MRSDSNSDTNATRKMRSSHLPKPGEQKTIENISMIEEIAVFLTF